MSTPTPAVTDAEPTTDPAADPAEPTETDDALEPDADGNVDDDPEGADQLGDPGKKALASMKDKLKAEREKRRGLEAQLAELRSALIRLGFSFPAATTLLGLERRLGRSVGPDSARYAAALRAHRFDPRAPDAPGPSERRALRRELSGRSPRARLRGLVAIPPGGPRPL